MSEDGVQNVQEERLQRLRDALTGVHNVAFTRHKPYMTLEPDGYWFTIMKKSLIYQLSKFVKWQYINRFKRLSYITLNI